jgi:hypothetical protein
VTSTVDLGIIVVTYNSAQTIGTCLGSAPEGVGELDYDIVVVDNASTDDTVDIASGFPRVRVVRNELNRGFAAACNQGIDLLAGRCRYILLLNPDAVASAGAFQALASYMDDHPLAGACGPLLVFPDGLAQPFSFGQDPTLAYLLRRQFYHLVLRRYLHDWGANQIEEVDWISGACMMLRPSALQQVGRLDEGMFLYFEDNDLCLRLRKAGWSVVRHPVAMVIHIGGQSVANSPQARKEYYRNLERFYTRHYGLLARCFLRIMLPLYRRLG